MDLQPRSESITVQEEFLKQTAGLIYKVGGVTLDGAAFGAETVVKAGTAIQVGSVAASGGQAVEEALPYDPAAFDRGQVFVTAHDAKIPESGGNVIIGAVEEAYLNTPRVTGIAGNEDQFVQDSNYRFKLR